MFHSSLTKKRFKGYHCACAKDMQLYEWKFDLPKATLTPKELIFQRKLKFCNPYIFQSRFCNPLIFQTMNYVSLRSLSLKYQRFPCTNLKERIRKFQFVARTQFLFYLLMKSSEFDSCLSSNLLLREIVVSFFCFFTYQSIALNCFLFQDTPGDMQVPS